MELTSSRNNYGERRALEKLAETGYAGTHIKHRHQKPVKGKSKKKTSPSKKGAAKTPKTTRKSVSTKPSKSSKGSAWYPGKRIVKFSDRHPTLTKAAKWAVSAALAYYGLPKLNLLHGKRKGSTLKDTRPSKKRRRAVVGTPRFPTNNYIGTNSYARMTDTDL